MSGIKLGRVEASPGLLLFAAWMLYQDSSGLVCAVLFSCFLHEIGHWLALRSFGIDVKLVSITIFGAKMFFEGEMSYTQEVICAGGGPAVNLLLAWLCGRYSGLHLLAGINLTLAVFNLLPVGQLDGARILRCTLSRLVSDRFSFYFCECLDFTFTVFFVTLALYLAVPGKNLNLLLVCFWLLKRPLDEKTLKIRRKRVK